MEDKNLSAFEEDECLNLDELEEKILTDFQDQMQDFEGLEEDRAKISNPAALGETVKQVVWEQFINQVGVVAGEDFVNENRGMKLDLSKDAHTQTTENFKEGKIATHNDAIDYQERYDDWQSKFQREKNGTIQLRTDYRTQKKLPTLHRDARDYIDSGRPVGSASMHKDHTIPAAEIIRDPEANAHLSQEEHASFANSADNLGDLVAPANMSKRDSTMTDWLNSEREGLKPDEKFFINKEELLERDRHAREVYAEVKQKGEERSIQTGKQSRKNEAMRMGGKALRAAVMALLLAFLKEVMNQFINWLRSAEKKFQTFIESMKKAIKSFVSNLKQYLINAGDALFTSIFTALIGPIVGTLKKAWIFLKQGYSSVKEAVNFFNNPANKNMPFSLKLMNVGKIIIAGLTAGGAILLGEVIEKALLSIPGFAFEIPILGSLANILGIFFGAAVSGLIGALALNLIDRLVAKKQLSVNTQMQINKSNDILNSQEKLLTVSVLKTGQVKYDVAKNVFERHEKFNEHLSGSLTQIESNSNEGMSLSRSNNEKLDNIEEDLNKLMD